MIRISSDCCDSGKVVIFNQQGVPVFNAIQYSSTSEFEIDLSTRIYFLWFQSEDYVILKKLVISN